MPDGQEAARSVHSPRQSLDRLEGDITDAQENPNTPGDAGVVIRAFFNGSQPEKAPPVPRQNPGFWHSPQPRGLFAYAAAADSDRGVPPQPANSSAEPSARIRMEHFDGITTPLFADQKYQEARNVTIHTELSSLGQRPSAEIRRVMRGNWRVQHGDDSVTEPIMSALERLERAGVSPNISQIVILDRRLAPGPSAPSFNGFIFLSNSGTLFIHQDFIRSMAYLAHRQTRLAKERPDQFGSSSFTLEDKWIQVLLHYHARDGLPASLQLDPITLNAAGIHPQYPSSRDNTIRAFKETLISRVALSTTHLDNRSDFVQRTILGGAISKDGELIATGSTDGQIYLWDAKSGERIYSNSVRAPQMTFASAQRFSKDGSRLATTTHGNLIDIIHTPRGPDSWRNMVTLAGHRSAEASERSSVHTFRFSPDNRYLVSGANDGTAIVWDLKVGKKSLVHTLQHDGVAVMDVDVSPDGRYIVTVDRRARVRLWNLETGALVRRLHYTPEPNETRVFQQNPRYFEDAKYTVEFSPDGNSVAVSGVQGHVVRIWSARSWKILNSFNDPARTDSIVRIAFSDDGRLMATADTQGTVHVWDIARRRLVQYHVFPESTLAIRFDPDSHRLAVFEREGVITRFQAYPENDFFSEELSTWHRIELRILGWGLLVAGLALALSAYLSAGPYAWLLPYILPLMAAVFGLLSFSDRPRLAKTADRQRRSPPFLRRLIGLTGLTNVEWNIVKSNVAYAHSQAWLSRNLITVSNTLVKILNSDELQAIVARELVRLRGQPFSRTRRMLHAISPLIILATVALAPSIGWVLGLGALSITATLAALLRVEVLATYRDDRGAIHLTENSDALISGLRKIDRHNRRRPSGDAPDQYASVDQRIRVLRRALGLKY